MQPKGDREKERYGEKRGMGGRSKKAEKRKNIYKNVRISFSVLNNNVE